MSPLNTNSTFPVKETFLYSSFVFVNETHNFPPMVCTNIFFKSFFILCVSYAAITEATTPVPQDKVSFSTPLS